VKLKVKRVAGFIKHCCIRQNDNAVPSELAVSSVNGGTFGMGFKIEVYDFC